MQEKIERRGRICYILEELFNYLISILVAGSYLAKLTTSLGISDGLTAILTSFVTLGCCTQLLSGIFFKRGKVKKRITGFFLLNQLLFLLLYLVPFVQIPSGLRIGIFAVLLLFGSFSLNIALSPRTNWFMSFVDDQKRGIFTAKKEGISLLIGFVFQLGMGALIDQFEACGNIRGAFIVCAAVIFALSVGHTLSLIFAKDQELPQNNRPLSKDLWTILTDKKIRPLLILSVLWALTNSVATPFFGTYTIKELGFSMSFLAVMSLVTAGFRIVASIFLGSYADKHSFAKMLKLCYFFIMFGYLVAVFLRPENGHVVYTIYTMLIAIAWGGINSAGINLVFDYVPAEKRTLTLAARTTIYGVVGFLTSAAAAPFLQLIQNAGNRFLGMQVYAQQILSGIACLCAFLTLLYLQYAVPKLNAYKNSSAS